MAYNIKDAERNVARNNILDRAFQGIAAAAIVGGFYQDLLLRYVHAIDPVNYVLAGVVVTFAVYVLAAPLFRR